MPLTAQNKPGARSQSGEAETAKRWMIFFYWCRPSTTHWLKTNTAFVVVACALSEVLLCLLMDIVKRTDGAILDVRIHWHGNGVCLPDTLVRCESKVFHTREGLPCENELRWACRVCEMESGSAAFITTWSTVIFLSVCEWFLLDNSAKSERPKLRCFPQSQAIFVLDPTQSE